MVSESLMDLDREYALAPPITDQQPAGAPDVNAPDVNAPDVNAPDVHVPDVNAPEVVGVQSVVDAAVEPASADGPELIVDSAASDRVQIDRVQSEAPVSELDFWPSEPSEPDPRPSFTEDASKDATFPGTSDPDSDPSERLNAIKQRLARQIENS